MIEADRSALFLICSDQLNPSPKSSEECAGQLQILNIGLFLHGSKTHLVLEETGQKTH